MGGGNPEPSPSELQAMACQSPHLAAAVRDLLIHAGQYVPLAAERQARDALAAWEAQEPRECPCNDSDRA